MVSASVYSQGLSPGLKAKNDGNNAYKVKNYVGAISSWETYFGSGEESVKTDSNTIHLYIKSYKYAAFDCLKKNQWSNSLSYFERYIIMDTKDSLSDGEIAYCMAYCAFKINKNDVALSYFEKAKRLNYQPDKCNLFIANIYKNTGYEQKMKDILVETINQYPHSSQVENMKSMLIFPLLKEAAVPFNIANGLAKKASMGTNDEYIMNMKLACAKFLEAIPLFDKVLKYNSSNEQALNYRKVCYRFIDAFEEYKKINHIE